MCFLVVLPSSRREPYFHTQKKVNKQIHRYIRTDYHVKHVDSYKVSCLQTIMRCLVVIAETPARKLQPCTMKMEPGMNTQLCAGPGGLRAAATATAPAPAAAIAATTTTTSTTTSTGRCFTRQQLLCWVFGVGVSGSDLKKHIF